MQSSVSLNVPCKVMLKTVTGWLPELVSVTVWGALVVVTSWLAKFKTVAESVAHGPVPVPDRLTVCGLLLAVSDETVRVAVASPQTSGEKTTLMVQLPPGAMEGLVPVADVLQVSVSE